MRHGVMLGLEEPFLHRAAGVVTDLMQAAYPELADHREHVARTILLEEKRFISTLRIGMRLLNDQMDRHGDRGEQFLSGAEIFKLYDTYGFPLDLTQDALKARGIEVDLAQFDTAMEKQRADAHS